MEKKFNEIVFKTGGTTSDGKGVVKTFENLKRESLDINEELKFENGLKFITTTTDEHLFGFTFFRMLPDVCGFDRYEARINYPEDINIDNAVLVTTPSFLEAMRKFNAKPAVNPKVIIAAGARLEDTTFEYALTIAERVIEIYGSTETGVIAYRTSPYEKGLRIFKGIKIVETADSYTTIETAYSKVSPVIIQDRIKLEDGKIEFLGRCGRVLKIQEKRIILDDIEAAVKDISGIEDVYCFEHKGKLAALAVLDENGKEFFIKHDKLTLVKKLKQELKNKFEMVPQRWRFFDEIPKKENGKINKEFIEEMFNLNLSLPFVISRETGRDYAEFELCFIKNSNFFKGHFEKLPILPGVVQLFYANWFTGIAFNMDCRCGQIRKIKYSNIIKPAKIIRLELVKSSKGVSFKYHDGELIYSSGILPPVSLL